MTYRSDFVFLKTVLEVQYLKRRTVVTEEA